MAKTIQDIARLTGFSVATVSRAINGTGYVKESTRKKIAEVVCEHGYVPSAVARSLSTSDTSCVGVIVPDIANEFFAKVISGVAEVAEQNGYHIMLLSTNESRASEHDFLNLVEAQRVAGLLITPVSEEDETTRQKLLRLREQGLPVVLIDRDVPGADIDGVFSDNIGGAYAGVRSLIAAGHTKIATIAGPETSKPGKERLSGYTKALADSGIEARPEYIAQGDFKRRRAYECASELLRLADPPTAIFTANNLTTLGCLQYFTERGIKIGEDISLLGFDDVDALRAVGYGLSVIDRDMNGIGRAAMELLLKNLRQTGTRAAQESISLPCGIILRGSEKLNYKK